jgi:dTDP-4-amino-4,6-dideoxygalactose transaminase
MIAQSALEAAHRTVPFFVPEVTPEAQQAAARVLASGWLTTGPEVSTFEQEFSAWLGVDHAVAISSCTSAIEISLMALGLPPGAKVLTTTMTFCGAVHAIVHAGLRPVLVDVNPETLMPDTVTIRAALQRCGEVDAMLALHFAGHPASVVAMADAAGLPLERVVEDAAHALGTWVEDKPVGAISAATCFSFYATKNLPIGEGGMITTNDARIAGFARRARLHGMSRDAWKRYLPGSGSGSSWRYAVDIPGLKANFTDLQAAIGSGQLRRLHTWQQRREELARRYQTRLSSIPGLGLPLWPATGRHAWHLYVVRIEESFGLSRDDVIDRLAERGVGCSVHFIPIHRHAYYQDLLRPDPEDYAGAEAAFNAVVSLPLYPTMTDEDIDYVCSELAAVQRFRGMPRNRNE